MPIAFMLTSSENHEPIVTFLKALWAVVPLWVGASAVLFLLFRFFSVVVVVLRWKLSEQPFS